MYIYITVILDYLNQLLGITMTIVGFTTLDLHNWIRVAMVYHKFFEILCIVYHILGWCWYSLTLWFMMTIIISMWGLPSIVIVWDNSMGYFPLLTIVPVTSQWGHYDSTRWNIGCLWLWLPISPPHPLLQSLLKLENHHF